MNCQHCEFEVTSKMYAAVKNNQCPACGEPIMDAAKAAQYQALQEVLGRYQLTTNPTAEVKIREKIISILLEHFEFTLTKAAAPRADLIELEEEEEDTSITGLPVTEQVVKKGSSGVPRRISREGTQVQDAREQSIGATNDLDRMRREVFEDAIHEEGVIIDEEGGEVSLEEAAAFFPGAEDVGAEVVVEQGIPTSGVSRVRRMRDGQ